MKIRKLSIKNYKIFDDVEFDFTNADGKTLDTVVFAGVNGCGKTTVLEVIAKCLNNRFNPKPDKAEISIEVEFDPNSAQWKRLEEDLSHINYKRFTLIQHFSLKLEAISALQKVLQIATKQSLIGAYFPIKVGVNYDPTGKLKISEFNRDKDLAKHACLKIIRDAVFKDKNLPPKVVIDEQIKAITHAVEGMGLNTRLVDLESDDLVFESANGQRIQFDELSHGEQNLYFRAFFLYQLAINEGVILVDEPEAAFHPTWQQKIAQLYCNIGEGNQVFLSTHSPHIMASVPPESLFVLHIDESEGKRKIQVLNMAKEGKHSQGLEPNRILKEVMQVDTLRDYQTQRDIERLSKLLTLDHFEGNEAENLAEKLTEQLGRQDPFIIRMEHQLLMLRRKKGAKTESIGA